jgi:hypothetical protein
MFLKLVLAGNGVSVLNKLPTFEEPPRLVNSPDESDEFHEEEESSEEGEAKEVPVDRVRMSSKERTEQEQLNLLLDARAELLKLSPQTQDEKLEIEESVEEAHSETKNLRKYSLFG